MKRIVRLTETDLIKIINKVLVESKKPIREESEVMLPNDLVVSTQEKEEIKGCTPEDFTADPILGKFFQKIFSLPTDKLKSLYSEVKTKMQQNNVQEQLGSMVIIAGMEIPVIFLGLVALGILTALISRIGGGGRGGYTSSGHSCKATRRDRSKGRGLWGGVKI